MGVIHPERLRQIFIHALNDDADATARDVPGAHQLGQYVLHGVDRDGKANALALWIDGRIDPYHLPPQVEQGTAAVPRVDARVGLNEVVVRTRADRAPLGADDPHRHRISEPEGIADRDDVFADAQSVARPEGSDWQSVGPVL